MKIKLKLSQLLSLCFLGIALLPTMGHAQSATDPAYAKDDSCIPALEGADNLLKKSIKIKITAYMVRPAYDILNNITDTSLTDDINAASSGLTGMVSPTLGADVLYAQAVVDGFVMKEPDCNKSGTTVTFCYDPIFGTGAGLRWSNLSSGNLTKWSVLDDKSQNCGTLHTLSDGVEKTYAPATIFRGKRIGDKICVQIFGGYTGWVTMGCRWFTPPDIAPVVPECFVGESCINGVHGYSKSILPISGVLVACFRQTMDLLFVNTETCQVPSVTNNKYDRKSNGEILYTNASGTRTNLFHGFQQTIKKTVTLALTLYVIFFGIKVILGQQIPAKGEIFIFILKMILVVYFALGNGLKDDIKPAFENVSLGLSQAFFQAGGNQRLCNYTDEFLVSKGIPPYAMDKKYLALWDALDCRVGYYLGFYNVAKSDFSGTVNASSLLAMPAIITFFIPLLLSMQIVMALATLIFGVLFLLIVVYVVHTYLVALIGMNIVLYLAPLMVPMSLFKFTRGFFDGWIKILMTFAIQPVILFVFLALMMTVFDRIYYNTCEFKTDVVTIQYPYKDDLGHYIYPAAATTVTAPPPAAGTPAPPPATPAQTGPVGVDIPIFSIDEDVMKDWTNVQKVGCTDTMGYALFQIEKDVYTLDLFIIKIRFPTKLHNIELATKGIWPLLLFSFLFYFFAVTVLGDLAGDLMGTFTVGSGQLTVGPKDIMDKLMAKAKQATAKSKSK